MDPNDNPNPESATDETPLAAMEAGIEAATEAPADPPAPTEPEAQEQPAADPVPGTPEALAAEQAAAAAKPADAPVEPAKDAEVEKEITTLKLGEKAGERFRTMAAEIKTLAPIKEALEKAGVKDAEQFGQFMQRNEAMTAVMGMMDETGASSEQFGQTFDYLSLVNAANKGDRKAAERAFEIVSTERKNLAQALGIEIDGFDPLAEFPDLKAELEAGDITRPRALELAQQKRDAALRAEAANRQAAESQQQSAQAQAIQQGRDALTTLERELLADPTYAAKRDAFYAEVREICRTEPPSSWARMARYAYRGIAAPVATKPPPGPLRPGGIRPAVMPVTDDPMEALNQGIALASGG